jgi:transcriptional regulator with XRE-family HTH domain
MSKQFAIDLRLARRRAGYTQRDCAHLLAVHQSKISALEHGRNLPDLEQICMLSLIYGRSFEALFGEILQSGRYRLRRRLRSIPKDTRSYAGTRNRERSLEGLETRLVAEMADHD